MKRQKENFDKHRATAVVVNDDPTQLNVLTGLLQKEGLDATAFESAEGALVEMNATRPPDLIITDLYMPGIDGWRFCRLLRSPEYEAFNAVPILVVSATFAGDEASRITADLGANAFLPSPVDGRRFIDTVRAVRSGEKPKESLRVLVVEDSRTLAGLLAKRFEEHGYQADVAFSRREASKRFTEAAYDIAVLDYHLPDGLGDALLQKFRMKSPNCVCVMITTDPDPKLALSWMKAGAAAYLRKPFDPEYLIEQCIRTRRERALLRVEDLLEERTRQLQQSEAYYRTLFESANDAILVHEIDAEGKPGRFIAANPAACERLGYTCEEMLERRPRDIAPADGYKDLEGVRRDIAATGRARFETTHVTNSGRRIPVESHVRTFQLEGRRLALSVSRDQSEFHELQRLLRERSQTLQLIIENTSLLIAVLDDQGCYEFVSESHRQLGYPPEEILGGSGFDLVCPEDRPRMAEILAEGLAGKVASATLDYRMATPQGELRDIEGTFDAVIADSGRLEKIVFVGSDVTERRRTEDLLQKKSEEQRLLLDTIDTQVWYLTDIETYGRLNQAHADFLGVDLRAIAHKRLEEFVSKEVAEVCKASNIEVFQKKRPVHTEEWIPNADGEERLIAITKTPKLDANGKVEYVVCAGTDITVKRLSEERFRRIFEDSPIGIELYDNNGRLVMLNSAAVDIFGIVDPADAIGFDLFADPNVDADARKTLAAGRKVAYEAPFDFTLVREAGLYRTARSDTIDVSVQIQPLRHDDAKSPAGYVVIVQDLSERNRILKALSHREEQLRLIVENSTNLFYAHTPDHQLTYVSPRVEELLGYTPEEAMVKWTELATDNPINAEGLTITERAIATGEPQPPYELELRHKTGRKVYIEIREAPVVENGVTVSMVGSCTDITARREAEEMLRESEAKYRLLAENVQDVIWVRDMNLKPVYSSPSVERIRGYTPEEALKQNIEDVLTPESAKIAVEFLAGQLEKQARGEETETHYQLELEHWCKNGNTVWMELTVSWIYEQGPAPWGILGVSRDITERRQLQEERLALQRKYQQVQKAESLDRMTGAIAHLFNNHLAAVVGNLELLEDDLQPGDRGHENLKEAQTAVHRAAETSGLMLTFLGQSEGKPVPVDLPKACRQRIAGLKVDKPMEAEIRCELPDSGPVIRVDRSHLDQIVSALVTNAWESLEKSGEVCLSVNITSASDISDTHRFPIDWEPNFEKYACLRVADTGCGMDDTTIGRIFDPFFTDKFTGRGLGLPVVLGIVKASEGCVTVESEPGRGSVFQVFWPLSSENIPVTGGNKSLDSTAMRGEGTILLVEDHEMVRKMAKAMINRLGFEVLMAKDGKEAVEIFRERWQEIHLVLTDLTMPQLNGWDTLEALRRIRPDIPVILTSGYDQTSALDPDRSERPQAFLNKPYQMVDLKRALARALGDTASGFVDNYGELQ